MSDKFPANSERANYINKNLTVVGIGASAGGLSALEELFDRLPSDSGSAYVIIQHLSPDFKSLMKELLERHTDMKIYRVTHGMVIEPNSIYLIPPGKNLVVEANMLLLEERKQDKNDKYEFSFPIDLFFTSLAKNYGEKAIGVILSGTGSDGTYGLRAISEAGGVALVQDPATAEFDGMPRSAISTNVVNEVLPIAELAQLLYQYLSNSFNSQDTNLIENSLLSYSDLKEINKLLMETENIDFSFYKTTTMSRRIHRRRLIHNFPNISSYIDLLHDSIEERKILVGDLLINVTSFFRDRLAWENLENNILPILFEKASSGEELRFWVAGCSTGEEAYSLAILINEAMEDSDKSLKVKIFATDIDRTALDKASTGIYPQSIAQDIDPERLQKYFIPKDDRYQVKRKLREMLIFSPHNLTKDAGFTRINLVSCRNVLIYMQTNLQQFVLRNFHFSLVVGGTLFLGEAESTGMYESEFITLDKKWKIYKKLRDIRLSLSHKNLPKTPFKSQLSSFSSRSLSKTNSHQEICLQRILQENNAVILLVSSENRLLHVYGNSGKFFLPPQGQVLFEVTKMVIVPLQLPLNTALHRAKKENKTIFYSGIEYQDEEKFYEIGIKVIPPQDRDKNNDFFVVEIKHELVDLSEKDLSQEKFKVNDEAQQRIVQLEQELQHTRENLQALVEELETTNEEQQASNEELTSSNEELQSTNEELHSVNEELHTVNIEYQSKIQELIQLNNDIDNLLYSTNIGVIFLDSNLRIRKYTPAAVEVISVRRSDLERPIKDLNLRIECPSLLQSLEMVLTTHESIEMEVKHKEKDNYFLMRINPYKTEDFYNEGISISFIKINEIKVVQKMLERALMAKNRQLAAIETASDGIAILNKDCFVFINQAHVEMFGYSDPEDLIGKSWEIFYEDREIARLKKEAFPILKNKGKWQGIAKAKHRDGHFFDEELTLTFAVGGDLICVCRDITELLKSKKALENTKAELEKQVAHRTERLAQQSDRLKQIHRLSTTVFVDLESLLAEYLETGCRMLNLSTGILTKVENDVCKIIAIHHPEDLEEEKINIFLNSYCAKSLETLCTVTSNKNDSIDSDRELKSYITTPIFINADVYGILSFFDIKPRENDFTKEEEEIVELMAKDLSRSIASDYAKQAVRESEKRFRSTFDQAAVGIAHVSIEGRFLRVNQRFCDIIGDDRDSLKQLTFQEITHPEDLTIDLEYFRQVLAGEIDTYSMEKRYFHRDGSIVWVNLTVSLVKNNLEEPDYFIGVIEEISDRKENELELEKNREQLKQANIAKDAFIAHMSHELRTPLNSIIGFSDILRQTNRLEDKEKNIINIIHQSGEHLLSLINDILDFSKVSANKLKLESQKFDFYNFLNNLISVFQLRSRQKSLIFVDNISSTLPQAINTDRTKLRQVLYNLIGNAIKFTETGSITFKVGYVWEFEESEVDNQKIRFQIEDTGIGIPSHKFADIFLPFGQLPNNMENKEGTGLGLTICQAILKLMGGEIKLISEPFVGTKFWFDLELMEVEIDTLPTRVYPSCKLPYRLSIPRKILVVDDNNFNRNLLVSYLEPLGFILAEANNGEVGLSMSETFQPDAILVDLIMPVMDGMEMISNLQQRQSLENTVIIIISAQKVTHTNLKNIARSCAGFLAKPVNLEDLLSLLEDSLELNWELETINSNLNNSSTMLSPPQEELQELLKLVNYGDLESIEQQIKILEENYPQYNSFNQEVRQLINSCQQAKLENWLKSLL